MNPVTHPFFLILDDIERPDVLLGLFGLMLLSYLVLFTLIYFSERPKKKKVYHRPNDLVKPE